MRMLPDAYKQGRAEKEVIIGILAGVITSAAQDNRDAFDTQIRKTEREHFPPQTT